MWNNKRVQLDDILSTFNLTSIISFPARVQRNSVSAIDNVFVDLSSIGKFKIKPQCNGLSEHNEQMLLLNEIPLQTKISNSKMIRDINKYSLYDFQMMLSYEDWDDVFSNSKVDTIFNSFLNTYLRIFYSCFPLKKLKTNRVHKARHGLLRE
jgi:hypothetical protein